ncbi:MAG: phosphoribosyltransferase family protein [Thermomicrobium sp.]|nr:phosphoribosyltransferase family protein [Thermomicrobium sp.]MDW8060928.1 phosphoribosyltransferase family protein [Thermomicrobium sp.]
MFRDRFEAGRQLAERLRDLAGKPAIVLALPRGGVLVGYEIARSLRLPLDVILTRKIGAPFNPEYAIGVVAENGFVSVSEEELAVGVASEDYVRRVVPTLMAELERRRRLYREGRPLPDLTGKTAILVDDGVATGFTMLGAIAALREQHPAAVVLALPVAPPSTVERLRREVDRLEVLLTPEPLDGVGAWYEDFHQASDEEVVELLRRAREASTEADGHATGSDTMGA